MQSEPKPDGAASAAHDSDVGSAGQQSLSMQRLNRDLTRRVLFKIDIRYDYGVYAQSLLGSSSLC